MPAVPHQLQLYDRDSHCWTFRVQADAGYRLRVSRDGEDVGMLGEPDLCYILHEHGDDYSAAQAICSRLSSELAGGLPSELKTAVFAGFATWIRSNRNCVEKADRGYHAYC